jgi:succinate-semialdehyde dehydrogenase/glutarate-semialdehyde dehydrogenase
MEVYSCCDSISYYAKRAPRFLAPEKRRIHGLMGFMKRLRVVYKPLGVVGLITPWNGPVVLAVNPLVQALLAGNAVVHKPSEVTPFSALVVKKFTEAAGFPADLYQVLQGDGSTGAALIESGVDKVSFTGSVATGRKVAEACGRRLIPCTLELGGKDPMIVCADADLERAARGAVWGAFTNAGQVCMSTERVYVVEPVAQAFIERVVELTRELRQGPESEGEVDVGAITSPGQLEIIEQHVADALAKGAKVLTGGRRNPAFEGFFFEPTVLVDVNHDMAIMRDETFGPCLPIQVVKDEEAALELANQSCYGLQASVWTRDSWKGKRLANRIAAGGVVVDDCIVTYGITESPFGGVKQSGIGRERSSV